MKLQTLIDNASSTYGLDLDVAGRESLLQKLRRSGVAAEVSASAASSTIDTILSYADSASQGAQEVYADLKDSPEPAMQAAEDVCPRCKDNMRPVLLVGSRKATYCQACNIALPFKAEG